MMIEVWKIEGFDQMCDKCELGKIMREVAECVVEWKEFEEERVGVHKSVNLHSRRMITTYYAILEACQIDITRDSILRTQVDNFQVKLHNDSFLHSARSLYTIASDLSLNWLIHTPKNLEASKRKENREAVEKLYELKLKVEENDGKLDEGSR